MKRLLVLNLITFLIVLSFTACKMPAGVPDLPIRAQQMEIAPDLIINGFNETIQEIANDLDFSGVELFKKQFKDFFQLLKKEFQLS